MNRSSMRPKGVHGRQKGSYMPFYKVSMSSAHMCGFDTEGYFQADSEENLFKLKEFEDYEDAMRDYVEGWAYQADVEDDEDPAELVCVISEIKKEEYLEMVELIGGAFEV